MIEIYEKMQQWAAEYTEIGGGPVPQGLIKFLTARLSESGMIPDQKDIVTIRRDGRTEKVRIISQDLNIVMFEDVEGKSCMCTVDQMKKWCKSNSIVRAADYSKGGESGRDRLIKAMGGDAGTGTIPLDVVDAPDVE